MRHLALLALGISLIGLASATSADTITGRVVGVSDGDTITVLDGSNQPHKVRLAGIDAPEKAQAFGQASKQHLANHVFGRQVTLECSKRDKYRREICTVYVYGQDQNLAQIEAGLAWWYRQYAHEQEPSLRMQYELAEHEAQIAQRGLWRDPNPTPPWEWRYERKTRRIGGTPF
ncbi:thermonuclease family protein [Rhodocyclus tenuis]|uniref:Endonuclease YncB(Thermonuclease family) n=1 Tax=Rhodocyclus tenuis TaxID=1066 RepID=A0A840GAC3_RHOTE|nr:thermonuclease family protein [Rhodocyclus tenuis]MBB4248796.1 endonuclease YncB(thermonuclease family) [Rhodocyclus tenuis]